MKIIKYLILSLLTVFFMACPDNPTETQGNVDSVSVTGSTNVQISNTIALTATGGASTNVTWSSSHTNSEI